MVHNWGILINISSLQWGNKSTLPFMTSGSSFSKCNVKDLLCLKCDVNGISPDRIIHFFGSTTFHLAMLQRWKTYMHAESHPLQRGPGRKMWSWCSQKALQRQAKETVCPGGKLTTRHGSRRLQTITAGTPQRERQVRRLRQRGNPAAKERCRRQKEQAASQPSSSEAFTCPKWSMISASRTGLYSHQQVCKSQRLWRNTLITTYFSSNLQPDCKGKKKK